MMSFCMELLDQLAAKAYGVIKASIMSQAGLSEQYLRDFGCPSRDMTFNPPAVRGSDPRSIEFATRDHFSCLKDRSSYFGTGGIGSRS